jgi:uncharacterized protein (DUF1919 family)
MAPWRLGGNALGSTRRHGFSIVADDCWGGDVYRHLERPYETPFVGLFVRSEDYLRLLGDLRGYLAQPLRFRDRFGESGGTRYPVGLLEDVEIHFLHYRHRGHADVTWNRRLARLDFNRLAVKFSAAPDERAHDQVERFARLPFERKVAFSRVAVPGAVHVPNWSWRDAFAETQSVFDAEAWLRGRSPHRRRSFSNGRSTRA